MRRLLEHLKVPFREASGQYVIDCPKCGKDEHCHVDPATGLWHCKVCDQGGNPFQLIECYVPTSTPKERMEILESLGLNDSNRAIHHRVTKAPFDPNIPGLRPVTAGDHLEDFCVIKAITESALPLFDPQVRDEDTNKKVVYLPAIGGDGKICGYLRVRFDGQPYVLWNRGTAKYPSIGSHGLLCASWIQERDPETLLFVEGWRDCAAALAVGYCATASTGGASTWRDEWIYLFKGRDVVIIMDCDSAGQKAARRAADAMLGRVKSVKIVQLPYEVKPDHGEDLHDFLVRDGHTRDDLQRIIDNTPDFSRPTRVLDSSTQQCQPVIIRLADVESRPVDWLWEDRFALGKLSALAGDCDLGKSFIMLNIAARLSQGLPLPGEYGNYRVPAGSIILTAEDGLEDTIKPRLEAMNADCTRIIAIRGTKTKDVEREFDLLRDVEQLRMAINEVQNCRLVMIDPISSYLGDVDTHKDAAVRSALRPLAELADELNVAIVCISHLNKNGGSNAKYRMTGSVAFTAFGRSAWMVCEDPDDSTGKRCFMLPIKNNLSEVKKNGLAYRIANNAVEWEPGIVEMSAQDYIAQHRPGPEPDERREAETFLQEVLADGPTSAKEVKQHARHSGISAATLKRAKTKLGIKPKKIGFGKDSTWEWKLPNTQ